MNTLPTLDVNRTAAPEDERQHLIAFALTARTPSEIVQAKRALDDWLCRYPEDHSLEDAYGVLALRQGASTS